NMYYKDWSVVNAWAGPQPQGINMWATTDTPEVGLPFFGCNCNDPTVGWDDEYGQWWRDNCQFRPGEPEYFQPPRQRLIPSQQNFFNIYPMASGGVQALLGDGSVRNINTAISIQVWSAMVTPNGGEAFSSDQGGRRRRNSHRRAERESASRPVHSPFIPRDDHASNYPQIRTSCPGDHCRPPVGLPARSARAPPARNRGQARRHRHL